MAGRAQGCLYSVCLGEEKGKYDSMESLHRHMEMLLISEEFEAGLVSRCTPKYRRRYG